MLKFIFWILIFNRPPSYFQKNNKGDITAAVSLVTAQIAFA